MTAESQPALDDRPLVMTWILGGSSEANAPWLEAVERLNRRSRELGVGVVSPLRINLVFVLPGPLYQPDFAGGRTGKYDRALNMLLVQAAVTIDPHVRQPASVLLSLAADGLDAAERWAKRRHVEVGHLEVLRALTRALAVRE